MQRLLLISLFIFPLFSFDSLEAQNDDPSAARPYLSVAKQIIETALSDGQAYEMLEELTLDVGPRLSGSPEAAAAVAWGRQTMMKLGFDNVHLQEVMVPHWVRGPVETARVINSSTVGTAGLAVCALGGSVGTPELGIVAEVVEVQSLKEVQSLGKAAKGKIIFYNRPMNPRLVNTFAAYGGAVNQRSRGAIEAAKAGAVAVLVRSMTTRLDKVPHTGAMRYAENVAKIPAAAISTVDADFSEIPEEVIVLGGHLDSWDKGHGAHDDGAGCVQSIEALRLIKSLNLKPKRTLRAVLFMNEENGARGGKAYAEHVEKQGPTHIAAIESDRGGFTPGGFSVKADSRIVESFSDWEYLFQPMAADKIISGFGGADINPLAEKFGIPTIGLLVESHRYFDYHHSDNDTFDKVNERELELGAAAMAILAYVIAMEGVPD